MTFFFFFFFFLVFNWFSASFFGLQLFFRKVPPLFRNSGSAPELTAAVENMEIISKCVLTHYEFNTHEVCSLVKKFNLKAIEL